MLKIVVMTSLSLLVSLASSAADLNVCFKHEEGGKGILAVRNGSMSLAWFVEFSADGNYNSSVGRYDASKSTMVLVDSEAGSSSSKQLTGSALLVDVIDQNRTDQDSALYPKVIVKVEKSSIEFDVPEYKNIEGLKLKYPVVPCR